MRQAGRYDPAYQKVKESHSFLDICRTPTLAAEVAMQPIRRLQVDAAILFSDILVVPEAMGLELIHGTAMGPRFPEPLRGPEDLKRIKSRVEAQAGLAYVLDAVRCTRHKLGGTVPLIGFAGAPWSLMAYMVQGGGLNSGKSEAFREVKTWLLKVIQDIIPACPTPTHVQLIDFPIQDPISAHELLQRITDVVVDFLCGQVENGAQLLQVFSCHILRPSLSYPFVLTLKL